jgi:hypothetical protein
MIDCTQLKSKVENSILSNWHCESVEGYPSTFSVTTSALLPNNDCIELLVEIGDKEVRISDNGAMYNFFLMSGIDIADKSERAKLNQISRIIENYKVNLTHLELRRTVPVDDLALGIELVTGAVKDSCFLIYTTRPAQKYEFKERVFALFAAKQASVSLDYPVTGYAVAEHTFDIRLNGVAATPIRPGEVLGRTVSARSSGPVQVAIERAYFAFEDVGKTGRSFDRALVYDDSTPECKRAWQDKHLDELNKLNIRGYAFMADKEGLLRLAAEHRHVPA